MALSDLTLHDPSTPYTGEYQFEELLIDGDLLVFSSCAAVEYGRTADEYSFAEITQNIEGRIRAMQKRLRAKTVRIFFSAKDNFRYVVMPEYKSNRKDAWLPPSLEDAKAHTMALFHGEMEPGLEADDLLAIAQKADGSTIIATIDKDIPQVNGMHYRWETQHAGEKLFEVGGHGELKLEVKLKDGKKKSKVHGNGVRFFCYQLLIGDPTDGVMGCGKLETMVYKTGAKAGQTYSKRVGVGPVEAYELLEHAITYPRAMAIVMAQYQHVFGDEWEEKLLANGRCLFMTRKRNPDGKFQLWHFKKEEYQNSWYDPATASVVSFKG